MDQEAQCHLTARFERQRSGQIIQHAFHLFQNTLRVEHRNMVNDALHSQRADKAHRATLHLQPAFAAGEIWRQQTEHQLRALLREQLLERDKRNIRQSWLESTHYARQTFTGVNRLLNTLQAANFVVIEDHHPRILRHQLTEALFQHLFDFFCCSHPCNARNDQHFTAVFLLWRTELTGNIFALHQRRQLRQVAGFVA